MLLYGWFPIGEVSELADEHDLGSCALKGVGVRVPPSPPTWFLNNFSRKLSLS